MAITTSLRRDALKAGMAKIDVATASEQELRAYVKKHGSAANGKPVKKKGSKAVEAPVKRGRGRPRKEEAKAAPARKSTRKAAAKPKPKAEGRFMVEGINYNKTTGWNPREGSAVDIIFTVLKQTKGSVERTLEKLLPNAKDFVNVRKQDGTRRNKDEMRSALRYRILRTRFDFARQTGQHTSSKNRIAYGSGENAATKAKPRKNTRKASTSTRKKATTRKK